MSTRKSNMDNLTNQNGCENTKTPNHVPRHISINEHCTINSARNHRLNNFTYNSSFLHNGFNVPSKLPGIINNEKPSGNLGPNDIKTSTDINTCINRDGSIVLIVNTVVNIRNVCFRSTSTVKVPSLNNNPIIFQSNPIKQDPDEFTDINNKEAPNFENMKHDPEFVQIKEDPGKKTENNDDEQSNINKKRKRGQREDKSNKKKN